MTKKRRKNTGSVALFGALLIAGMLQAAPTDLITQAAVDGVNLTLLNEAEYCQLEVKGADGELQRLNLSSKAPCYFFPDLEKTQVQSYSYADAGVEEVLLIGGTPVVLTPEERQSKKLPSESYCTQDIQAISYENKVIMLGAVEMNAYACAEDRLDEKLYQQALQQPRQSIKVLHEQQMMQANSAGEVLDVKPNSSAEPSLLDSIQKKIKAIFE